MLITRRSILLAAAASTIPAFAKAGSVDVGVCSAVKNFDQAVSFGFDYFEPGVAEIATLSDDDFATFHKKVFATPLRCTSCNSFIRTLKVVGPAVDMEALKSYMEQNLDRCRQLGTEIVVWGSAGSRNVPPDFPRDKAWDQIKTFLRQAGDIARSRNIVVAIEPLQRGESNIINTGGEALQLVQQVGHPNVKMIIDYYHMRVENENPDILIKAADQIVHLHFANPDGRRWPKLSDNDPGYARFFQILKQIRYNKGLSIEGRGTFEKDAADSIAFFEHFLSRDG